MDIDAEPKVISNQIKKARENLGIDLASAADNLGINVITLEEWEQGISEPSLEDLWKLGELYNQSTDYFLKTSAAIPENISFRLESRKSIQDFPPKVRKVLMRFEELCRAEDELEKATGKTREILVKNVATTNDPDKLAETERNRLGIERKPVKNLMSTLSLQGIRIFTLPIPDIPALELSGMSWWHDQYGPCILINARNIAGRRLFTLAHEYWHILHHDPATVCAYLLDIPEERFANTFAAIFLMPEDTIKDTFFEIMSETNELITDVELGKLAAHFGVSLEAAGRRLEGLGLIPHGLTDQKIKDWQKKPAHYRNARGPKWKRQVGERFISLAIEAYRNGQVSVGRLARYFDIDVREASKIVKNTRDAVSPK